MKSELSFIDKYDDTVINIFIYSVLTFSTYVLYFPVMTISDFLIVLCFCLLYLLCVEQLFKKIVPAHRTLKSTNFLSNVAFLHLPKGQYYAQPYFKLIDEPKITKKIINTYETHDGSHIPNKIEIEVHSIGYTGNKDTKPITEHRTGLYKKIPYTESNIKSFIDAYKYQLISAMSNENLEVLKESTMNEGQGKIKNTLFLPNANYMLKWFFGKNNYFIYIPYANTTLKPLINTLRTWFFSLSMLIPFAVILSSVAIGETYLENTLNSNMVFKVSAGIAVILGVLLAAVLYVRYKSNKTPELLNKYLLIIVKFTHQLMVLCILIASINLALTPILKIFADASLNAWSLMQGTFLISLLYSSIFLTIKWIGFFNKVLLLATNYHSGNAFLFDVAYEKVNNPYLKIIESCQSNHSTKIAFLDNNTVDNFASTYYLQPNEDSKICLAVARTALISGYLYNLFGYCKSLLYVLDVIYKNDPMIKRFDDQHLAKLAYLLNDVCLDNLESLSEYFKVNGRDETVFVTLNQKILPDIEEQLIKGQEIYLEVEMAVIDLMALCSQKIENTIDESMFIKDESNSHLQYSNNLLPPSAIENTVRLKSITQEILPALDRVINNPESEKVKKEAMIERRRAVKLAEELKEQEEKINGQNQVDEVAIMSRYLDKITKGN